MLDEKPKIMYGIGVEPKPGTLYSDQLFTEFKDPKEAYEHFQEVKERYPILKIKITRIALKYSSISESGLEKAANAGA